MAVYKKGNRWYMDVYLNGQRKRKSLGPANKLTRTEAEKIEKVIVGKLLLGEYGIFEKTQSINFKSLFSRYLKYSYDNYKSPSRVKQMENIFFKSFGNKNIADISSWDIEKYKSSRKNLGIKNSTINRELTILRRMFNLAVEWDLLDKSPMHRAKLLKLDNTRPVTFSPEHFEILCKNSCDNLRRTIITAYYSGLRRGEIVNLRWKHIDFINKYIYVEGTKNGESRTVALHPLIEKVLREYPDEHNKEELVFGYKNGQSLQNSFRKAMKRAGIIGPTFHSLRHTFATNLVMKGVDIATVKELLGHKSIIMTMRYSHPSPEHKRQAVMSL